MFSARSRCAACSSDLFCGSCFPLHSAPRLCWSIQMCCTELLPSPPLSFCWSIQMCFMHLLPSPPLCWSIQMCFVGLLPSPPLSSRALMDHPDVLHGAFAFPSTQLQSVFPRSILSTSGGTKSSSEGLVPASGSRNGAFCAPVASAQPGMLQEAAFGAGWDLALLLCSCPDGKGEVPNPRAGCSVGRAATGRISPPCRRAALEASCL